MKNNIFIPKKINVGYQNRADTYTGKLAYIIYYDEKGKLRKETSWNKWRDKDIPNKEFENVPTSGFVINKKVGDYDSGWNHRHAYCRIYDPRNFEFEITFENLLYILENANSIKGKGLEGEFIYGWDGKDLVLIPVESPDYKEISDYNKIIHNKKVIKAKDLIIGATYLTKNNVEYVYMGKFDKYENCYWKDGKYFKTKEKMDQWCKDNNILPNNKSIYSWEKYKEDEYAPGNVGKQHCFYHKSVAFKGGLVDTFSWMSSIGNNLIDIINDKCCENYADLFYILEGIKSYSPIDRTKERYFEMSFEEFCNIATAVSYDGSIYYKNINFMVNNSNLKKYCIKLEYPAEKYILYEYGIDGCNEVLDIFPTEYKEETDYYGKTIIKKHMIPVTLEDIFYKLKPVYKQLYLANGREYIKEYKF